MPKDDPVVQRVRAARREIVAECGCDAHSLLEWAKQIERDMPDRIRRYEQTNPKDS